MAKRVPNSESVETDADVRVHEEVPAGPPETEVKSVEVPVVEKFRVSALRKYIADHPVEFAKADSDPHKFRKAMGLPAPTRLYRVSGRNAGAVVEPVEVEAHDESDAVRQAIIACKLTNPSRCRWTVVCIEE